VAFFFGQAFYLAVTGTFAFLDFLALGFAGSGSVTGSASPSPSEGEMKGGLNPFKEGHQPRWSGVAIAYLELAYFPIK